jgi:hypothetical protein
MKRILPLFLLLPLLSMAQEDDSAFIRKLSDEILTNGKAYEQLRYLTKKIGARLAGSPQMVQAEQWGYKTFKDLGADNVWMQQCMVPHWVRGKDDRVTITEVSKKPFAKNLDIAALGNSLGSNKPVLADVLAVQSFEELEKRKNEVKGKIVYYNAGFNPTNIHTFNSYGQSFVYRRNGASEAAKYGAVGVMIRSLTEAPDNIPHTGAMAYDTAYPKIPAVALGSQDADYVWDLSKKSPFKVSLTTHGKFLPDTIGHNVIAEIKGREFPDQYITIGGHLDSWDLGEGAHDDGAGIVQTIEVFRAFTALGYKPRYTIRFVLFANEENGLRGGEKYAAEAKAKKETHIFALESDAGGFTPRSFGFSMEDEKLDRIARFQKLLQPYGTESFSPRGGGSDVGPLHTLLNTPVAGLQPDSQRYFDVHHARSDVFENVNKRELLLGAVNMAGLIYLVDKYGF